MRKRLFKACYAVSAVAGTTVALGLGAVSANASVATTHPHRDTPQCQAYNGLGRCVTWEQYNGLGPLGLRIEATATAVIVNGVPVGGSLGPLSVAVPVGSAVILSCAHVFDNGQHLALTGSNTDGAQATFKHPTQNNLQFWVPRTP